MIPIERLKLRVIAEELEQLNIAIEQSGYTEDSIVIAHVNKRLKFFQAEILGLIEITKKEDA